MRASEQAALDVFVNKLRSTIQREYDFHDVARTRDPDFFVALQFVLDQLPKPAERVDEWNLNGIPLAVGGPVKILPSMPRKRDGFDSTVRKLVIVDDWLSEIEVTDPKTGAIRTYTPDRVGRIPKKRKAKT